MIHEYFLIILKEEGNYLITLIPPNDSKIKYTELFNQTIEVLFSENEFIPIKIEKDGVSINEFIYSDVLIKVGEKTNKDHKLGIYLYPKKELALSINENDDIIIYNDLLKTKLSFKCKNFDNIKTFEVWHENGNKKCKYSFDKKTETKIGEYLQYSENGSLNIKCYFENDKIEGILEAYHENGMYSNIIYYKNNMKNRKFKEYFKNGNLHIDTNYLNDKLNGEFKEYYDCKLNEPDKFCKYVNCNYINNKIEGKYIIYYKNGGINIIYNFINGLREGECIFYYENGSIYKIYNYINDDLEYK